MLAAVGPRSDGFGGGLRAPSGRPTDVGGNGFGTPGAAAAPPGVPTSGAIEARNNRGSNVLLPYARLVPLHARASRHDEHDVRELVIGEKRRLEYENLRPGELAWILGRRLKSAGTATEMSVFKETAHMGLGHGVDRVQRLASTDWVEALVQQRLGSTVIELHKVRATGPSLESLDPHLAHLKPFVAGSTLLHFADLAHAMAGVNGSLPLSLPGTSQQLFEDPHKRQLGQGIFVMDKGPFLRGLCGSYDPVVVERVKHTFAGLEMARNAGDNAAFSLLDCELRRRNLLDWTPDGICLSKLDSPAGEALNSAMLDAQSAQLYNVAVKGPAVTTAWTSDVRDHKLECHPTDRVFICVVADLAWKAVTKSKDTLFDQKLGKAATARGRVLTKMKLLNNPHKGLDIKAETDALNTLIEEAADAAEEISNHTFLEPLDYAQRVQEVREKEAVLPKNATKAEKEIAKKAYDDAVKAMKDAWGGQWPDDATALKDKKDKFEAVQEGILSGDMMVNQASLCNFRLMRTTSAHLSNYSAWNPQSSVSRCGLPLGVPEITTNSAGGVGSYIVGGWCIGTVMDAAASRSTVGQLTRTAPMSMAMQVAVDVEWLTGDQLYAKYMDKSGATLQRGEREYETASDGSSLGKRKPLSGADRPVSNKRPLVNVAAEPPESAASSSLDDVELAPRGRRV